MCCNSTHSLGMENTRQRVRYVGSNRRSKEVSAFLLQVVPCVVKCIGFAVTLTLYKSWIYY